jgi:alkaline phosphatase
MLPILRAAVVVCLLATTAGAQTIYPVDRAEILAGARFDLKVEFPGAVPPSEIKVTINGEDAAKLLGRNPLIDGNEDGLGQTAYWMRSVELPKAGRYVVEATDGKNTKKVAWEAFAGAKGRLAKNVILLIGDGMSMAHRTAARMLSKGIHEGKYGGELAMDDMPYMALVSTSGTDSIVTDSANAMSAYTTGHKSCVNALGVYCARNRSTLGHPNVETIAELAKRKLGMALGIVTDAEVEDATPAGMVAHTRRRSDYDDIVRMMYWLKPDVILGGGSLNFLPAADGRGKRKDGEDYVAKFQMAGYAFAANETELAAAAAKPETTKLLGLFNEKNVDGALDRRFLKKGTVAKFPDQPDLTDQARAALEVLSRSDKGFLLMVEAGRIDKFSHSLDWERAVYDTIMFDNVVKIAKDFAAKHDDTLVIVVPDHAHPVSIIGTYDDGQGEQLRDRLQTYAEAGFPSYPAADKDGYPDKVDVQRRLAVVFAAYPDYCDPGRPYLEGENEPTVAGPLPAAMPTVTSASTSASPAAPPATTQAVAPPPAPQQSKDAEPRPPAIANEVYCKPGAARKIGNLPFTARNGVHAADDVVLTATGPGADVLRGRIDNTFVFRAMAQALGLGP